jgi:hypothetical protein
MDNMFGIVIAMHIDTTIKITFIAVDLSMADLLFVQIFAYGSLNTVTVSSIS